MGKKLRAAVGLLSASRQQRLLDGLTARVRAAADQRRTIADHHKEATQRLSESLQTEREVTLQDCRLQRRQMLEAWDQADESLISEYETKALHLRDEIDRTASKFRKARKAEHAVVERKVKARIEALHNQYREYKPRPETQRQKDYRQIDQELNRLAETLAEVRQVTVRRLNGLPDVVPEPQEDWEAAPTSVREAIEAIETAHRQVRETLRALYNGTPSRLVDTFWILPTGAGGFVVLWALGVLLFYREHLLLGMLAGIGVALVLFLSVLGILQIPLRRQTRRIYPRAEHLAAKADRAAEAGRKVSDAAAEDFASELVKNRDFHLEAAERWRVEHRQQINQAIAEKEQAVRDQLTQELEATSQTFRDRMAEVEQQMRNRADATADVIRQRLDQFDRATKQRLEACRATGRQAIGAFDERFRGVVQRTLERIADARRRVTERFPDWSQYERPDGTAVDFLPVGHLEMANLLQHDLLPMANRVLAESVENNGEAGESTPAGEPAMVPTAPASLSVVLHRQLHAGLVIDCETGQIDQAIALVRAVLWHAVSDIQAGRCYLTLMDPLGRGQHFADLMALTDHDARLINHRVWTSPQQIEAKLLELTQHNEDILQSCLRDQYPTVEAYNEVAGSLAEPYRMVAMAGLPAGLTQEGASHLKALIESARRCGTFLLMVRDRQQKWPAEFPPLEDARLLRLAIDGKGTWHDREAALEGLPFRPVELPPAARRPELIERIGREALTKARVEIPLRKIFPEALDGLADSSDGLDIPIGSQGADRPLRLLLGEGVRQHVLIAGKTGSGKSTLLHTIISAAAKLYRPDQLQLYLLDFKKGVEFQAYAAGPLPQARVIGIESEREFGRSVLQRLDGELQKRGEQFRDAGVQEIGDYRQATGQALPRVLLVVDEFQELFIRDDRLAGDCAMYLDRLVRQGRSFGMHVILSSQSLAGSYSLPRATLGQMAVRVALQSSESDAALILADDNPAARLISRPGEAIYNDAGGLVEGNQPFQVAWLPPEDHVAMLDAVHQRDAAAAAAWGPPVIFEGNRPTRWTPELAEAALATSSDAPDAIHGLLGEAIEIGPPTTLALRPATGRNVLIVADAATQSAVLAAALPTMIADWTRRQGIAPEVVLIDGHRAGRETEPPPSQWLQECCPDCRVVRPRDAEAELQRLKQVIAERTARIDAELALGPPVLVVITPLERFRELRQSDSYNFSLDGSSDNPAEALQHALRDGPGVGVHILLGCTMAETLTRWLPRSTHHDLELRLLGRMSSSDSANLIDTPEASDLSAATMLIYDDSDGRTTKFRQCAIDGVEPMRDWLAGHRRE